MQQKFIPFSPFKPKPKSCNLHCINNITISRWQKKAKPRRGNSTAGWWQVDFDKDEDNLPGNNNITNSHGQTKSETQARGFNRQVVSVSPVREFDKETTIRQEDFQTRSGAWKAMESWRWSSWRRARGRG